MVAIMLLLLLSASVANLAASAFVFHCEFGMKTGQSRAPLVFVGQCKTSQHAVQPINTLQRYFTIFTDNDELLLEEENADEDIETLADAINGTADGFVVTKQYRVPNEGFPGATDSEVDSISLTSLFSPDDISRLQLESNNVTLAAALMLLDPEKYPTQSRARKAIRQRSIWICRNQNENNNHDVSALKFNELGKVIARVYPGDIVGFQQRARSDYNSILGTPYRPPPFKIEVVYEDDHMAIVNKPAGIVVYRAEGGRGGGARGGHGRDTLLSALPYVLKPSKFTNDSEEVPLERPQPVHRLDRPTSGLTVVAKTKAAAVRLAQQFEFRKARKTYCAIVNGVPIAGDSEDTFSEWRTVDYDLDGKSAITSWRQIRRVQSLHGRDGQLTLVELKPKTGRYHQLRRHMAWVCKSPIVGDTTYDDANESALRFRERGLFLCANAIEVEHPHYNTPSGRETWIDMVGRVGVVDHDEGNAILQQDESTGMVTVKATIPLPEKFRSFMEREHSRANKFID